MHKSVLLDHNNNMWFSAHSRRNPTSAKPNCNTGAAPDTLPSPIWHRSPMQSSINSWRRSRVLRCSSHRPAQQSQRTPRWRRRTTWLQPWPQLLRRATATSRDLDHHRRQRPPLSNKYKSSRRRWPPTRTRQPAASRSLVANAKRTLRSLRTADRRRRWSVDR